MIETDIPGLEAAKERLRKSLSRMENVVERKVRFAASHGGAGADTSQLEKTLKQLNEENKHLRDEVGKIQASSAKDKRELERARTASSQALKKVDHMINELKQVTHGA